MMRGVCILIWVVSPWQPKMECIITWVVTIRYIPSILDCTYKNIILLYVSYGHWGENWICDKTYYACYQKDCNTSRIVSMHLYLSYDASCGHWSGHADQQ